LNDLVAHKEQIVEMTKAAINNPDFLKSISNATNNTDVINKRITFYQDNLKQIFQ
jgi:hypothetical protein